MCDIARGTECNIASRMKVAVTGKTGANLMAGTLSFYNGSSWRDVCGSNWDIKYAKVLCKELGFPQEGMTITIRRFKNEKISFLRS